MAGWLLISGTSKQEFVDLVAEYENMGYILKPESFCVDSRAYFYALMKG